MGFDVRLQGRKIGFGFLGGEHVIRRVADDGGKAGVKQAALVIEEHIGEFEFPVEGDNGLDSGAGVLQGHTVAYGSEGLRHTQGGEQGVVVSGRRPGHGRAGRVFVGNEVGGRPHIGNLAEGGALGFHGFEEQVLLFLDLRDVVGRQGADLAQGAQQQRVPDGDLVVEGVLHQGQLTRERPELVNLHADQRVAVTEVVVQEGQRLGRRDGGQP